MDNPNRMENISHREEDLDRRGAGDPEELVSPAPLEHQRS